MLRAARHLGVAGQAPTAPTELIWLGIWCRRRCFRRSPCCQHGGTVFGIVAMLLVAAFVLSVPRFRTLLISGIAAACLLLPWMLWQKLVQPPGNALVQSVFAGVYGFDKRRPWGSLKRSAAATAG